MVVRGPLRGSLSGWRVCATGEALSAAAKAGLVVHSQTRVADMFAGLITVIVIGCHCERDSLGIESYKAILWV
jgi:hypothetical protein